MKLNLKAFFSNISSLVNIWSLIVIFNADDTPSMVRYFYYFMMIFAVGIKYFVKQYQNNKLFYYLLDIDPNMFTEDIKNQKNNDQEEPEEADAIKMYFFIIYNYYLLKENDLEIPYAVGLFLIGVDQRIKRRKEGFLNQLELTIYYTTHIIIFRYFYLNSTWTELLQFYLISFAAIIIVSLIAFGPSRFSFTKDFLFVFLISSYMGRCGPTFQERKLLIEKQDSEEIASMQGFIALNNLILGYYYFSQMDLILKCFLIVCLPIALMKIYRQICIFAYGPFQVKLNIDKENQVKQLIKLKQYQYIVTFNFKELTNKEIKYFISRFVAINPQVYYEIAFNNVTLLQFKFQDLGESKSKRLYTINYTNIESIQLQIEAFFMSKLLSQEQSLLIDFMKLYIEYQTFKVDRILLDIDNFQLCSAVKNQTPSQFYLDYLRYKKSVIIQKLCFLKNISEMMTMNSNEIFYDLYDN